jgi:uncharacterized protein
MKQINTLLSIEEFIFKYDTEINRNMIEKINEIMKYEVYELQELNKRLSDFVKFSTAKLDESHDYFHMLKVVLNTLDIIENDYTNHENYYELKKLALIVAWLHDVRDHKYLELSISESLFKLKIQELSKLYLNDEYANQIILIIDNISFSKENKKKLDDTLFSPLSYTVLKIVADADRLEAIGQIGIERCTKYGTDKLKIDPKEVIYHVIYHAYEKLLRLYPENFIKTERGKFLAKPLHQEMVDYVKSNSDQKIIEYVCNKLQENGLRHLYKNY